MFVTQCLRRSAVLTPDKPALVCGSRSTTFSELLDRVARCAGGLMGLGFGVDQRVAILGLNSDRVIELMYGSIWAHGVSQNLNFRWTIAEQAYAINDSAATLLAIDKNFVDRVPSLREQCPQIKHFLYLGDDVLPQGMLSYEELVATSRPVEDQCSDPNAMAFLNYTGGTTGLSKGVMLTHAGLMTSASMFLLDGLVQKGKMAIVAPLFHVGGALLPLAGFLAGSTIVVMPMFAPLDAIKLFHEQRIEQVSLAPTTIQMIVDHPDLAQYDLSCLKYLTYGGSPISEALVGRIRVMLPQVKLAQVYGQTEGIPATVLPDEDHAAEGTRLRSAGRPALGCEVKIIDRDGNSLAPEQIGEVAVRGLQIMRGYWNKPELTAHTLQGGWLRTGDAGYLDGGYLYIADRVKDMVVTGGENVYSAEVENAVAKHPAVAGCAVIGIPDDKWGEAIHAIVVFQPGMQATAEDLQGHCRGLIANYKLPRSFEFRDALPLTSVGKVNKVVLREPFWGNTPRRVG